MRCVKISSLLSLQQKNMKIKVMLGTAGKNRTINCIHWSSPFDLVLGLRGGEILLVSLQEERGRLTVIEIVLRDVAFLQVLWSGIMKSSNSDKDNLAVCSVELGREQGAIGDGDRIIISANTEGIVRVWSARMKKCVMQIPLSELLRGSLLFDCLEGKNRSLTIVSHYPYLFSAFAIISY
jgi:WD40 repeat protein